MATLQELENKLELIEEDVSNLRRYILEVFYKKELDHDEMKRLKEILFPETLISLED